MNRGRPPSYWGPEWGHKIFFTQENNRPTCDSTELQQIWYLEKT